MGFLSNLFGSKQTASTSMDPAQRQILLDTWGRATNVADRPYQPYTGQRVAGLTPIQQQGINALQGAQFAGMGSMMQASNGMQAAQGYQPQQVSTQFGMLPVGTQFSAQQVQPGRAIDSVGAYFNPYLDKVAGGVMSNLDRARQQTLLGNEDAALAAGAYGGSRHGVVDAETNRNFFDSAGKTLAGLYSGGWDSAINAGAADANRALTAGTANQGADLQAQQLGLQGQTANQGAFQAMQGLDLQGQVANQNAGLAGANLGLSASNALAGLGGQQQQMAINGGQAALTGGALQQANQQSLLDADYNQFLANRDYNRNNVSWLSQIMNGMPSMGSTTTQSRSPGLAELGMTLGSAYLMSDENVKSDVREIDSEDDVLAGIKKTPVSTWRYDPAKGGPNDPRPHIGPMAQDVKRNLGIGDGKSLPVVDVMGAHHAAISALAKKVDKLKATEVKIKRINKRGK